MPKVVPGYKDEAKRKIIQTAVDVISERGFAMTTIDEIAHRLGVSKGAVYWYFPNREALNREVFAYIQDDFKRIHFNKYYNQSLGQFLHHLFDRFTHNDYKVRNVFFEMVSLSQRSALEKNSLTGFLTGFVQSISEIIAVEQKNGKLDDDIDPEIFAFLLVSHYFGIHLLSMMWLPQDKMDAIWKEFESRLLTRKADSDNLE